MKLFSEISWCIRWTAIKVKQTFICWISRIITRKSKILPIKQNFLDKIFNYLDLESLAVFGRINERSKQLANNYIEKGTKTILRNETFSEKYFLSISIYQIIKSKSKQLKNRNFYFLKWTLHIILLLIKIQTKKYTFFFTFFF